MIQVAILCAKARRGGQSPCGAIYENLAPGQVEQWVEKTLRDNGWYTDDHDAYYCPKHNPTEQGAAMAVTHFYRALGESGWEARLPEGVHGELTIEIRPRRWLTSADPEPGRDVTVEEEGGTRWHRTDGGDHDGAANWEKVGVGYFEPESWTKVAGNYGPVRVANGDG